MTRLTNNTPLIDEGNASQHTTYNEGMLRLSSLARALIVASISPSNSPPGSPVDETLYLVGDTPTGAWVDHAGEAAVKYNTTWYFIPILAGMEAVDITTNKKYVYTGGAWKRSVLYTRDVYVAQYATGGTGTLADPYTGWLDYVPWASYTTFVFDGDEAETVYYDLPDTLDIGDYPGIKLVGDGSTVLKWSGVAGGRMVNSRGNLSGSTPLCWNQQIEGLEFDGNGRPGDRANAAGTGIRFRFSHGITLRNVVIHGLAETGSIGLYLDGWTVGGTFDNVFVNHAKGAGLYEATGVTAERGIVIEAIDPADPEYNTTWVPTFQTWVSCQAVSCSDVGLDILSVASPLATVQELRFVGCAFPGNGGPGIRINANSQMLTFVNVNLESNGLIAESGLADPLRTCVSIAGGRMVKLLDCTSNQTITIDSTSQECDVIGGQHATVVDDGDATTIECKMTLAAPTGTGTRRRYRHHSPSGNAARYIYSTYNNDADAVLLRVENRHTGTAAIAWHEISSRNNAAGPVLLGQAAADGNFGITGLSAGDFLCWVPTGKTAVFMRADYALADVLSGGIESRGNITANNGSAGGTATPTTVDLGDNYSSTAGTNLKFKLFSSGGSVYGMGVSGGQLDYVVPTNTDVHAFWVGGNKRWELTDNAVKCRGTQVVGLQGTAVADATDAASAITQLNLLLARIRAHGLIAT